MQTSEQLSDLAKSLAKAQAAIKNAAKDSTNPHFKSRYADLASAWDAIREPLTSNGLSVVQGLSSADNKVTCTTMLLHESGQWIRDAMTMTPQQNTPQGQGSCATYLRRYMLMAIAGVAPDDDDGNEASTKGNSYAVKYNQTKSPVVQNPVAAPAAQSQPNAPAGAEAFTKTASQIKQLAAFLTAKSAASKFDEMCKQLDGKEFTRTNINAAWDAIQQEVKE